MNYLVTTGIAGLIQRFVVVYPRGRCGCVPDIVGSVSTPRRKEQNLWKSVIQRYVILLGLDYELWYRLTGPLELGVRTSVPEVPVFTDVPDGLVAQTARPFVRWRWYHA